MSNLPQVGDFRERLGAHLRASEVALLEPVDVEDSLGLLISAGIDAKVTILDPWYNKGIGGIREDYVEYICGLLDLSSQVSEHVFLWGFPEVVARFVDRLPPRLELVAWLTWYYKNNPSVIRGWRSSQMACLHLARDGHQLYPEHFLNDAQLEKKAQGKLRYMPGPTSVIEAALLIGFVGRKEQTGHKAQKPVSVFKPLIEMTTKPGDLVFDPLAGSGTAGAAALATGRRAVLADHSAECVSIMRQRLEVEPVPIDQEFMRRPAPVESAVPRGAVAGGAA
jgi:site-specific DNA-methyltransferase (adenine-specific)